jgi:hypothetical protein
MRLRSKEWFFKQCLLECDRHGPLHDLSWDILLKGMAQSDSTRGHVTQAIGGVQWLAPILCTRRCESRINGYRWFLGPA